MITYRDYVKDFNKFKNHINEMVKILDLNNIEYDKIEIEECIFDSKVEMDNRWLNLNPDEILFHKKPHTFQYGVFYGIGLNHTYNLTIVDSTITLH